MKNIKFAAFSHFPADFFKEVAKLSLEVQNDDLVLPTAVNAVEEVCRA